MVNGRPPGTMVSGATVRAPVAVDMSSGPFDPARLLINVTIYCPPLCVTETLPLSAGIVFRLVNSWAAVGALPSVVVAVVAVGVLLPAIALTFCPAPPPNYLIFHGPPAPPVAPPALERPPLPPSTPA